MYLDTMGLSFAGKVAHRQLCDYIWINDAPPPCRESSLRDITSCGSLSAEEWSGVMLELAEKGWVKLGGYLVHRAAVETLNESKDSYAAQFNKTSKQTKKMCVLSPPDSVTGCVTLTVTPTVTKRVTDGVTKPLTAKQSQSESEVQTETVVPSQTSQSNPKPPGTMLTFSMLERVSREIIANEHDWCYDNHKLRPDTLAQAALVGKLKAFVGRVTERQAHEAWQEAATRTHKAVVDNMEIKSLPAYAAGCWEDQLQNIAEKVNRQG